MRIPQSPPHRGLQLSELETPTTLDKKIFARRGQWSVGVSRGAGTDDGCRSGLVSEFGRRIEADHLLGAHVAVWLHVKQQTQTVLASSSAADYNKLDSFLRVCLDASNDAIEKLSTD